METSGKKLALVVVMVATTTMMTTMVTLMMKMRELKVVYSGGILSLKRFENLIHVDLFFIIFIMGNQFSTNRLLLL